MVDLQFNGGTGRDATAYAISYKTKNLCCLHASEEHNSTKVSGRGSHNNCDKFQLELDLLISEIGTSKDDSTKFNIAWKATDKLITIPNYG